MDKYKIYAAIIAMNEMFDTMDEVDVDLIAAYDKMIDMYNGMLKDYESEDILTHWFM